MSYFTQDFIDFFAELKQNNSKVWFDENRKRYETSVKQPFQDFVQLMIARIQEVNPELYTTPKESIFRINRDIRFSKDKTPYKTNRSALIVNGGKKSKGKPGIHFSFSPDVVHFHAGVFMPEKEVLSAIRHGIADNPAGFRKIIESSDFVNRFGELRGEKLKRVPSDLKEAHANEPYIANKSFYVMTEMPPEVLLTADLPDKIMHYYEVSRPLMDFLEGVMQPA